MSDKKVNLNTEDLAKNVGEVAEKTVTNVTNIIEKHKSRKREIRDTLLVVGAGIVLLKTRKDVKQLKNITYQLASNAAQLQNYLVSVNPPKING